MCAKGDLVSHRAGKDKEGGGVTGQGGNVSFERVGGGVGLEDVVEESRVGGSREHCWSGGRDNIAFANVSVCSIRYEKQKPSRWTRMHTAEVIGRRSWRLPRISAIGDAFDFDAFDLDCLGDHDVFLWPL